jgi:hypothetical protein
MTPTDTLKGSERYARCMLAAWNSGDVSRLRNELNQIAVTDSSHLPAFEREKFAVVQGVAQTIRVWLSGARKKQDDLNVALELLRHVAATKEPVH